MEEGPTGLTTSEGLKGTLRYYSPELIRDSDACHSLPSDIWAWACLALEVLADMIPYAEKKSEHSIILALMNNEPPSDTISLPIPVPAVKHLLARCWTVQPNERPSVDHCLSIIAAELSALQMTGVVGGDSYQRGNLRSFNFDEDRSSNRQLHIPNAVSLVNSARRMVGPSLQGGPSAPLDPAAAFGGMGQGSSAEAQLEQLAANVRSSTTTTASDRAKQVFVQPRSISTSPSHSASSAAPYGASDLGYGSATASPFARHLNSLRGQSAHNRTISGASKSAFTHITSPADSPPLGAGAPNASSHYNGLPAGHQTAFKSSALARSTPRTQRSRPRPYDALFRGHHSPGGRTGLGGAPDEYPSSPSPGPPPPRSDDISSLSMFQQPSSSSHRPHHLQGAAAALGGQQPDYSGLFVTPPPAHHQPQGYSIHPNQLGGIPHHQQHQQHGGPFSAAAFGGVGQGLSAEALLEQLAANVRSSTTTTASDRAKQVFVQALLSANYAPYPDGSVPRQGLYNSYRRYCDAYNIPHINTATLGKAIRLCFPNITTRRVGVRGNSKYHYCGIRPATVAEAEFLQDFVRRTTNHAAIAASSRRGAAAVAAYQAAAGGNGSDEEDDQDSEVLSSAAGGLADSESSSVAPTTFGFGDTHSNAPSPLVLSNTPHPLTLGGGPKSPTLYSLLADDKTPTTNTLLSAHQAAGLNGRTANNGLTYGMGHAQIMGRRGVGSGDSQVSPSNAAPGSRPGTSSGFAAGSATPVSVRSLPNFPFINEALGIDSKSSGNADGSSGDNASAGSPFSQNGGSPHHQAAIHAWRSLECHLDGLLESVRGWRFDQFEIHVRTFWASLSGDYREVVHAPAVAGLVVRADAVVYDEILEILRTQMLATIPPHSLASLRQLAEKMEKILLLALEGYGNTFVEPKVELGARFGHLVLRSLDMYQVTQVLTSVLSNAQQVTGMRRAWSEVDFESVRNQAALMCNCLHEDLQQLLEVSFVAVLDGLMTNAQLGGLVGSSEPVRDIMNWADMCYKRLMGRASGGAEGEKKPMMKSRSVLIRLGYVTSQIMRDLTIRNDPSFGAFQILNLLIDDWIALNVLRSVALQTNSATQQDAASSASSHPAAAQRGNGSDEKGDKDSEVPSSGAEGLADSESSSVPPTTLGFGDTHSNSTAPLAPNNTPHPLTLRGGPKGPKLYSMLGDDKTPATNTLLSAHQAASLNGRTANNGLTYGMGHAQIMGRGGVGSGDSQVSPSNAAPGSRPVSPSNAAPGSRPGTSSGFAAGSAAPVSVRSLPNFPSISEALGIDSKPPATADGSGAGDSNASAGPPSSQSGAAAGTSSSPHRQAAIEAWRWFEDHLDGLLESVRGWKFDQFEIHVRAFWASLSGDYREAVHTPAVASLVVTANAVVYDEILEILRTQMLASIPPHSLASLRKLAEKMEKILLLALEGYDNTFVEPKVELGTRFGHLVLRFLDMYQVTRDLTSVLSNAQQVADMRRAWSEVDFELVRNQAALMCNCRHEDLQQLLEVSFVAVLDGLVANAQLGGLVGRSEPVRDIMNWADMCYERLMGRASGGADGEEKSTMSSRSVLIRWGYVTSQVMRDLTIRSDPSSGHFQGLKLFLDDWIAFNVLPSIALSTNSVQASVEPVMQQQYLALSPMPGQEFTGAAKE
ncbi:hypothetical protein FRC05_000559 [Tulasnella sp. 425]|nr:hypothetical protein FRC05_000559 [Tulasnella sp. 425]